MVGSLSAVGNIVYVAEFTNNSTTGFMMRSGRRVFHYPTGTYTPVISDGRRLYLTGYSSITALEPFRAEGSGGEGSKVSERTEALARHRRPAHPAPSSMQGNPNRARGAEAGSG